MRVAARSIAAVRTVAFCTVAGFVFFSGLFDGVRRGC